VHEVIKVRGKVGDTRHALLHYAYPDLASYMSSITKFLSCRYLAFGRVSAILSPDNIRSTQCFTLKFLQVRSLTETRLVLNLFHSYYVFAKYAKAWEWKEKTV
jgi:hypothetical protein